MQSFLQTKCFYINSNKEIPEIAEAQLGEFIETAPRPHGIDYKVYATTIEREFDVIDENGDYLENPIIKDIWVLAHWSWSKENVFKEFESKEDAESALKIIYEDEIFNNLEKHEVFLSKEEAQESLDELMEELRYQAED